MKMLRKISALVLAIMMIAAMGAAFASSVPENLTNGEVGGFAPSHVDTPNVDNKKVNIIKEITVYNKDESYVYGPAITYTYTVVPASGTELVTITDDTADHATGTAVTTTALAGVTTGLTVNGGTAGTAASAVGTLTWYNTEILDASDNGTANTKPIPLDFSNVVFSQPGVYRYKITETTTSPATSAAAGVTTATNRVRYLDVYVMRSDSYNDSHSPSSFVAGDWRIYGYVCLAGGTTAVTTSTTKTNGFVDTTSDTTTSDADRYFTYNVTITKDVKNDSTMVSHAFPFNVAFTNETATGNFQLIAEKTGTTTTISTTAQDATTTVNGTAITANTILKVGSAAALSAFSNAGDPHIADENAAADQTTGSVRYIGLPAGTQVEVYETNDVVGTSYIYSYKVDDGTASTATNVNYGENTSSNKATLLATPLNTDDNTAHLIAFTNTLQQISPTGYVSRFAPYALILVGGIVLLIIAKKRKPAKDDEE